MLSKEITVFVLLDLERKVRIDPVAEFAEHFERLAQRWLMDDEKADHADVGNLAVLGHPKPERLARRCFRAVFQQSDNGPRWDHLFGIVEHRAGDPRLPQQRDGFEPKLLRNREVTGQRCGPNQLHPAPEMSRRRQKLS